MIDLDKKLEQARNNAKGYGEKRGRQAVADDCLKGAYAMLYGDAPPGPVADKDGWVRRQSAYLDAVQEKENRYAEWETARIYMQLLMAQCEKYRTDKATERTMDKAHR